MKLLIRWIVTSISIFIAAYLLPGVDVDTAATAAVAALVLGIMNALVKPILLILTLPINIMTLGLFTFILNAGLVLLVDMIVPGFEVAGFGWAILFSLVLSVVSFVLHAIIPGEK